MRHRILIIATLIFFYLIRTSYSKAENYNVYAAFGPLLLFPGSMRIGNNQWEIGLLGGGAYGVDRVFGFENYYSAFGVVLGTGTSPGFYAAMGLKTPLFWGFLLRGELNSVVLVNGFAKGEGQIGLAFIF